MLLLRAETLQTLDAIELLMTLLRVQCVEPVQLVEFALLQLRRQLTEARFVLQGAMLIGGRKTLVIVHPLLEVFFALRGGNLAVCL